MNRFAPIAIAAFAFAGAFSPATAQPRAGYVATPASAPAKSSYITRATLWHCASGVCTAAKAGSRDQTMCELMARQVGTLSDFSIDGAAMDAEKLAQCNAKAK